MHNFSLRLPYLIYLSLGSVFVGVLLAPLFREVPVDSAPSIMRDHAMMHGTVEVPAAGAPEVSLSVNKDPMDGWNLTVRAENFTFTPDTVNTENVPNTGHAHLYINDVKVARLYSPYFHIPELPAGTHRITVNLSSNDHSYYQLQGARIEAGVEITEEGRKEISG